MPGNERQAQAALDQTLWAARGEFAGAFWRLLLCRASFLKQQTGLSGGQAPHPHRRRAPLQGLLEKLLAQQQVQQKRPPMAPVHLRPSHLRYHAQVHWTRPALDTLPP